MVDYELLDRVDRARRDADRAYRCPFVEAIRAAQRAEEAFDAGTPTTRYSVVVEAALDILDRPYVEPRNTYSNGCVRAYNAQDDDWGWDCRDEVSGEFEAR